MPAARAKGRGRIPRTLINGQASAYSIRRRIVEKRDRISKTNCRSQNSATERSRLLTNPFSADASYFAATCAHFASVVRNTFASGGGGIVPFSEVLNGTM